MRPGPGALCSLLLALVGGTPAYADDPCAGVACDNGNACDGVETCVDGTCQPGMPLDCDDRDPCTTDQCNPAMGCLHTENTAPCADDANPCTRDVCDRGSCTHPPRADGSGCSDGLYCTLNDTCVAGVCQSGPPNCTGLTTVCRTGNCDESLDRCFTTPRPNGTPCGDGDICNGNDVCEGGFCRTSPPPSCEDRNPCTADRCDPALGCVETALPDGTACSDGLFCNGAETCRGGACVPAPQRACDDGNVCTVDTCDEQRGTCAHEGPPDCCLVDLDCADSDVCTTRERCRRGRCRSDPVVCPGATPCVRATCDPARGCETTPLPEGAGCEDGDPCTDGETCTAGQCGAPPAEGDVTGSRDLVVRRFVLRPAGRRTRLVAEGTFSAAARDALDGGITVEVRNPHGTTLYAASVPGSAFGTDGVHGHLVYRAPPGRAPYGGVKRLTLNVVGPSMEISLRAVVPITVGALVSAARRAPAPATATSLAWAIRVGAACVRDPDLVCTARGAERRACR